MTSWATYCSVHVSNQKFEQILQITSLCIAYIMTILNLPTFITLSIFGSSQLGRDREGGFVSNDMFYSRKVLCKKPIVICILKNLFHISIQTLLLKKKL